MQVILRNVLSLKLEKKHWKDFVKSTTQFLQFLETVIMKTFLKTLKMPISA